MFWSATGGGVRRYLLAKHAWLGRQPGCRHTLAVPVIEAQAIQGTMALPAWPLPGSGGYRLPVRRRAIADLLYEAEPDLIEVGDPFVVALASLDVAARRALPLVAYCHSDLAAIARLYAGPMLAGLAGRIARDYVRRVYGRFDCVLAPSESMRQQLGEWGIERVVRQPLGVDTEIFHPRHATRAWRKALDLDEGAYVLVYAGRFAAEKQLAVLCQAVQALGPPYVLVAIGAGPAPPKGERVRVLPFMASNCDLANALASADLFVHAGDRETFGLSVLEALASGTPVVARQAGALAELVDESVGLTVESARPQAFAEAIHAVCTEDRGARRTAARQRALTYTWEHQLAALLAIYRRLLAPSASATP